MTILDLMEILACCPPMSEVRIDGKFIEEIEVKKLIDFNITDLTISEITIQ